MNTLVVAGGKPEMWPQEMVANFDYYVGVDRGCLHLLEAGLPLDLAVGDFDSLNEREKVRVFAAAKEIAQSPAEKDDTDTQLALVKVFAKNPTPQIHLIGATGGRLDHLLANLWLALEPRFYPHLRQIQIEDNQNQVSFYPAGSYQLEQKAQMKYLAFCCLTPMEKLTLQEVKYPLWQQKVPYPISYASNEFLPEKKAYFEFSDGIMCVIQSRDA